ncbi:SOS response-associated peptidase family protein [Sphingomonas floccifaciens]|uniref:Abasic site processing protein n=1 Tax=Sphingomonas floccifaciens TaxID=1844115 RepID=A0ABW4NB07_9SPHN
MCNEAYRRTQIGEIARDWSETRIPLVFPEGLPNVGEQPSIRITDRAPIIRADRDGTPELVMRRWSWLAQGGRPVYNFRSDGRQIDSGRCLIPVDGFFEFTDPPKDSTVKGRRPKSKWAFTLNDHSWFCIAGIWQTHAEVGEAWSMLTCPPGPDIAPYHDRQVVVLGREDWAQWLDRLIPSAELCRPLARGSLSVEQIR